MGTLTTYAPLYFAAHGVTAAEVGILMSLVQVMRIVGPTLWGWVADHTRRRVLVLRMTAAGFALDRLGVASLPWLAGLVLLPVPGQSLRIREAPRLDGPHAAAPLLQVLRQPAALVRRAAAGAVREYRLWDRRYLRGLGHVVVLGAAGAGFGVWGGGWP